MNLPRWRISPRKTIRYYDEHNILKPSYVNENGARFYTDGDFARLQQILLLKYLGFSLDDIKEMTISDDDHFLSNSLKMQLKLIEDRIDQLQLVKEVLGETAARVDGGEEIDWSRLLQRINLTAWKRVCAINTKMPPIFPPASVFTASMRRIPRDGFRGFMNSAGLRRGCGCWRWAAGTAPCGPETRIRCRSSFR